MAFPCCEVRVGQSLSLVFAYGNALQVGTGGTTEAQDSHHREAIQTIAVEPASSFSSSLPPLIFLLCTLFHPFLTFLYILFLPFSSCSALLSVSHPFFFHTSILTRVSSNTVWLSPAHRAQWCTGIHFLQVLPLLLEWLICPPSQFWTKPRNTKVVPKHNDTLIETSAMARDQWPDITDRWQRSFCQADSYFKMFYIFTFKFAYASIGFCWKCHQKITHQVRGDGLSEHGRAWKPQRHCNERRKLVPMGCVLMMLMTFKKKCQTVGTWADQWLPVIKG